MYQVVVFAGYAGFHLQLAKDVHNSHFVKQKVINLTTYRINMTMYEYSWTEVSNGTVLSDLSMVGNTETNSSRLVYLLTSSQAV